MAPVETADPIVLLHSLGVSGAVWDPLVPALPAGARVLRPDLRGHGENWDGRPFEVEEMAADVARLLDAEGVQAAVIVGLSLGGNVALALAARHPARVAALLLADCTPWYGEGGDDFWSQRARGFEELGLEELARVQAERWFGAGFRERRPDEVERVLAIFRSGDPRGIAAACRALTGFDARPWLPGIAAPALVVGGTADAAVTAEQMAGLAAAIPAGELAMLQGAGHLALIERPEVLVEGLQRLRERRAAAGRAAHMEVS